MFGLVGVLRCSATGNGGTVERAWDIGKPGSQDTLKSYWKDEGGRERQMRAVRAYIIQYIGLFVEADADTLETFRWDYASNNIKAYQPRIE